MHMAAAKMGLMVVVMVALFLPVRIPEAIAAVA